MSGASLLSSEKPAKSNQESSTIPSLRVSSSAIEIKAAKKRVEEEKRSPQYSPSSGSPDHYLPWYGSLDKHNGRFGY